MMQQFRKCEKKNVLVHPQVREHAGGFSATSEGQRLTYFYDNAPLENVSYVTSWLFVI